MQKINDLQTKMIQYNKSFINENKKNQKSVTGKITEFNNKMNQSLNDNINKEIKFDNGDKYFGHVVKDKQKEKEFYIIIMEIEKWVIFYVANPWELMQY